jgi:hypothetical protein
MSAAEVVGPGEERLHRRNGKAGQLSVRAADDWRQNHNLLLPPLAPNRLSLKAGAPIHSWHDGFDDPINAETWGRVDCLPFLPRSTNAQFGAVRELHRWSPKSIRDCPKATVIP